MRAVDVTFSSYQSERLAPVRRFPLLGDPRVLIPAAFLILVLLLEAFGAESVGTALFVGILAVVLAFIAWRAFQIGGGGSARAKDDPEPWTRPRPWNRRVLRDDSARRAHAWGLATVLAYACVAVLADGARLTSIPEAILPVAGLGGVAAYHYLRLWRHGTPRLVLADLPVFTGEELRFSFVGGRSLAGAEVRFLLENLRRYLVETASRRGANALATSGLLNVAFTGTLDADGRAEVSVEIPPHGVGTDLVPGLGVRDTGVVWQLEAIASVPGVDYHGTFLLPIYDPPVERRVLSTN